MTPRNRSADEVREVPPHAGMLIESMRDVGYGLDTALADIVDNSISAGASAVTITVDSVAHTSSVGISDDGRGLSLDELVEAMRLGSKSPLLIRNADDLGRFGLGLKTASFSQCRRLTVVSRHRGATSAARWDLDVVSTNNKWDLELLHDTERLPFIETLGEMGTLVVWEKLDRAGGSGVERDEQRAFIHHVDEARSHLELVFHRFLAPERGGKRVAISLNNLPLHGLDPFHREHPATIEGSKETIHVGPGKVTVTPFTLPHHSNVSKGEWEKFAGRAGYMRNQGFYLYRAKRLIVHGTWFGLARQTELTRLARVRVDIPNNMDAAWQIDIKKAFARPPIQVRERLRTVIGELGAPARRVYERRGVRLHGSRASIWQRRQVDQQIIYALNDASPLLTDFSNHLTSDLRAQFKQLLVAISASLPMEMLFADLAGSPEDVAATPVPLDTLDLILGATLRALGVTDRPDAQVVDLLRRTEPFRSHWEHCEQLFATRGFIEEEP
jgi:hypothetical protein